MFKFIISLLIIFTPLSCFAAQPAAQASQPIHIQLEGRAETLDLQEMDILSQETFADLIKAHEDEHIPFILAQFSTTIDKGDGKVEKKNFYYEANGFTRATFGTFYLNPSKHRYNDEQHVSTFKNPLTNKPLTDNDEIHYFRIDAIQEGKAHYVGSDFDLHANPEKKESLQKTFVNSMSEPEMEALFDGISQEIKNNQNKQFHPSIAPDQAEQLRRQLIEESFISTLKTIALVESKQPSAKIQSLVDFQAALIYSDQNHEFYDGQKALMYYNRVVDNPSASLDRSATSRKILIQSYFANMSGKEKFNPQDIIKNAQQCILEEHDNETLALARFLLGYMNYDSMYSQIPQNHQRAYAHFVKATQIFPFLTPYCAAYLGDILLQQQPIIPKNINKALSHFFCTTNTLDFNDQQALEIAHTGLARIYSNAYGTHNDYQLACRQHALAVINSQRPLSGNKIQAALILGKICMEDPAQPQEIILATKRILNDIIHTAHNPMFMQQFQVPLELELEAMACRGMMLLKENNQSPAVLKDFNTVITNPHASAQAKARAHLGKALLSVQNEASAFENYSLAISTNPQDSFVVNNARLSLGLLHLKGSVHIAQDTKKAHDLFKQIVDCVAAPKETQDYAAFRLGLLYHTGSPAIARDFAQSIKYLDGMESSPSIFQPEKNKSNLLIGKMYLTGSHGIKIEPTKALPYFKTVYAGQKKDTAIKAQVELGLATAYYQLGTYNKASAYLENILYNGQAMPTTKAKALALAGSISALGGQGTVKDYKMAHDHFHAVLAIPEACPDTKNKAHHGLCNLYLKGGHGIKKDLTLARTHLNKVDYK